MSTVGALYNNRDKTSTPLPPSLLILLDESFNLHLGPIFKSKRTKRFRCRKRNVGAEESRDESHQCLNVSQGNRNC